MADPRRVAIVGAGPSGLFAAAALVSDPDVRVDIFDRLPTPFGLLRYGVAPDHASIKAVAVTLARVFDSDRVRFLGLVEFGRDVTAAELFASYDAVIYAVGAADDRHLGIPGEDLPGSRSARQFVAWYSGHPDAEPQPMAGVHDAVVIVVGNVAVDVARILLKEPSALSATDMPDTVLAALREAEVENVWLVGRRGPEHATFTTPELRELLETPGIGITLTGCDPGAIDGSALERHARANVASIAKAVAESPATADVVPGQDGQGQSKADRPAPATRARPNPAPRRPEPKPAPAPAPDETEKLGGWLRGLAGKVRGKPK